MAVIFGPELVDRSLGPVPPLYVKEVGVPETRIALVSGILFSIMAATGALGHHLCGTLLRRYSTRTVIAAGAHGTGFGVLTSASLTGMAVSPFVAGLLIGASTGAVFFVNVAITGASAIVVSRTMLEAA